MDVAKTVGDRLDRGVDEVTELDGGQVGTVYRVDLADGAAVVAKFGDTDLRTEARMLRDLDRAGLAVPDVLAADGDLLVLEYVEGDDPVTPAVERDVAERLATLHDADHDGPPGAVGFDYDTPSGGLPRPNPWTDSWVEFFRDRRLLYVARAAADRGRLPTGALDRVRNLAADIGGYLDEPDSPSLVHGDVWRENLRVEGDRVAAFLDPACYVGHAEVELAYADWTGSVGDPFFERYSELRGIDPGFDRRKRVYTVLFLLDHCWHFGDSYFRDLDSTLSALGY